MTDKRQVEFIGGVKIAGTQYEAGDRKSFPKEVADRYIARGWAKDPVTGESGERQPGVHRVAIEPVVQRVAATKKGA